MSLPERKGPSANLVLWVIASVIVMTFLSPDSELFCLGMVIFLFFFRNFFDRNLPPVLFYNFVLQWLFFQAQLIDGLFKGINLVELDFHSTTKPMITMLGLIAICSYFLGVHLQTRKLVRYSQGQFVEFLRRLNLDRLFILYGLAYLALLFFGSLIWVLPSLAQPLFVMTEFRWALFFLLFAASFAQNRLKPLLLGFILLDVALSLFSFFAHFRDVITISFIAYWIFHFRSSGVTRALVIPAVLVVIMIGSVWSTIKEDYRDFLNKGTGAQAVLVSRSEAYDKLIELVSAIDAKGVQDGFEELVDRISWIGAFDAVYNYVPARRPHQDGKLWTEGLRRTFMPRLFFPDKTALADSKELNYYSGLGVSEKDTSISLSMIAASYIDFGPYWMHAPIFLFGLVCGWIFKKAYTWGKYPPVGIALTMPFVFMIQVADNSINKLLPHFLLYFICLWGIKLFVMRPFLDFITNTPKLEVQHTNAQLGRV